MSALLVFAGPNGSGKSTVTSAMQNMLPGQYINADMIQRIFGITPLAAAQNATAAREACLLRGEDFTFESVLSRDRNIDLMRRARERGYDVSCLYVLTRDPAINIRRVEERARLGGHDLPPETVVARYLRCMRLIPDVIEASDHMLIFDNSSEGDAETTTTIAHLESGKVVELLPNPLWTESDIRELIAGNYGKRFELDPAS